MTRLVESSSIVAALGPTNTGKTHRAIERMLDHESGMIGLPLRLLAREVYDRVSARIGEERVALVTGEEKRVPRRPDYWVCTVEAMPVARDVDFLAVDEIQLAANRERGHVFTDRLLNARGRLETWFLGSDTMRPLVDTLVPTAQHRRFQRFSQLRYAGQRSLRSLPPRSAVVAFSTDQVYELAERLRRLRGGVAVVLGALSPRTRNAQVAMYQAGEVQYLVATDAIGMGLNLDVDHVAFAATRKFDGRESRPLTVEELAQIAGRAGRHLNDGTFGTLRPLPELAPRAALAIETHKFSPVRQLVWRSAELDFDSVDALLESLTRPPFHGALKRVERADDFEALKALSGLDEVRAMARDPESVALLWQVCQIPDFRKLLLHRHVNLLLELYRQLQRGEGVLDDDWLAAQVRRLSNTTGGIDTLTARLAAIRTWTYVSHRGGWLRDARHWQERTRAIEDALGDALHRQLVERFVERESRSVVRRFRRGKAEPVAAAASGPFAKLQGLMAQVDEGETEEGFVQRVVDAAHQELAVDRTGRVAFEGEALGRLIRGSDLLSPAVVLDDADAWTGGSRARLERRLQALGRDVAAEALGGFRAEGTGGANARGLAYRLEQGLGVAPRKEARAQWAALAPEQRERFEGRGVREGRRYVYVENALALASLEARARLAALWTGKLPPAGVPSEPVLAAEALGDREAAWLFGYEVLGRHAVRFDVVEQLGVELAEAAANGTESPRLESLGLTERDLRRVLGALGYRLGDDGRIRRSRRRRKRRRPPR